MVKNIISVLFTEIRFILFHLLWGKRFLFLGIQRFSPRTEVSLAKGAKIILGKKVRAHSGTRIRVREGASLVIGNDVAFSYNCLVTARNSITIGDGCEIGPGVMLFDHDHDIKDHSLNEGVYRTSPISIGKNVWLGANVIVLRGSSIGDNSVVGAGTIIKGSIPANTIVTEKQVLVFRSVGRTDMEQTIIK